MDWHICLAVSMGILRWNRIDAELKKFIPKNIWDAIIPVSVAVFNVLIILFPREIIDAARDGLNLWWGSVFPSLLPFVIGVNMLTGLGVVSFLGTLLEPFMYALFGVPGVGGFALITGMTSGYPVGAKVTALLREKKELTMTEAQRLVSFTNNSGPLFIVGVVGIGMFGSTVIGYLILAAHYTGAILTGLLFRYYKYNERKSVRRERRVFSKAVYNMRIARAKDGRAIGRMLGDAVKNAMETITQVGGFIILFSVIVKILGMVGRIDFISARIDMILSALNIRPDLAEGLTIGLVEMTNGCKQIASSGYSTALGIDPRVIVCCALISFGGFGIHMQSLSFLSKTDIKASLYILSKLIHAILSAVIAVVLYRFSQLVPLFLPEPSRQETVEAFFLYRGGFMNKLTGSILIFMLAIGLIALTVVIAGIGRKAASHFNHGIGGRGRRRM